MKLAHSGDVQISSDKTKRVCGTIRGMISEGDNSQEKMKIGSAEVTYYGLPRPGLKVRVLPGHPEQGLVGKTFYRWPDGNYVSEEGIVLPSR